MDLHESTEDRFSRNDRSQAVNIIGENGRIYTLERNCFRLVGESLAIINFLPSE